MTIALAAVALLVGLSIGAVGVGGVLLIPALAMLTPLGIQSAMATALLTFVFTGLAATALFQRRGSIDWSITRPVCAGSAVFGFVGAWANSRLDATVLTAILALLIVMAGLYTLFASGTGRVAAYEHRPAARRALLVAVGVATGFGSGLTGVGGPALSVPMLVVSGFAPLAAIGASQVVQIIAALSGSAGNLLHGAIDWRLAGLLSAIEVLGVWMGVHLAHAVNELTLRRAVGVLCVALGTALLVRLAW